MSQTTTTIAAQDEIWFYFKFQAVSGFPANPTYLGWLNVGAGTISITVDSATGGLSISGGTSSTTVDTLTTGVTYHLWGHYKKGTGSTQIQEIAFSTTGIKPLSGNAYASLSNGNRTAQITTFTLGWSAANRSQQIIFDKVRVATTCIGDNPP